MTREEAIEYLKRADVTVWREVKTTMAEALEMAIKALEQEPRKKGKWICVHHLEDKITYDSWKCSECQHDFNSEEESMVDFDEYKYCPNCGKEMESEE